MKLLKPLVALILVVAVFSLGWCVGSSQPPAPEEDAIWTCAMHPEVERSEPGNCPICTMPLVRKSEDDSGPRRLVMSAADRKLAEIVTAPIERRFVTKTIRMVGKVDYDETRIQTISAWIPGLSRLERLYVDYTGVQVRKGDHLVLLYSPEVFKAQEELLQAKRALETPDRDPESFLAESNRRSYASARDKLLLWGLSEEQIIEIEEQGTTEDKVVINSPGEGIVIYKALNQGDYVSTGTRIYQIAQLDRVWVVLDAYEQDLIWLRYGQQVNLQTEAYPGEVFSGWISFINWDVQEATRTIKVRVNVDNLDLRLKPGMFVRASVEARLAQSGKVMDPRLSDHWICRMHPEVTSDASGDCEVCGMDLVPAAELGYVTARDPDVMPIVVPATAVLVTGKRAVVYVEVPGAERPTFEGREIILGPRADDYYVVLAGLDLGEQVVVNGAFKIDSALQILAKPSMMSIESGAANFVGTETAALRDSLVGLYGTYLALQQSLAADDFESAGQALAAVADSLDSADSTALEQGPARIWVDEETRLRAAIDAGIAAEDLGALRAAFRDLSRGMITIEKTFGHTGPSVHYEVFCPIAFGNTGATWLQADETIANPYLPVEMPTCGEFMGTHSGIPGQGAVREETPQPSAIGDLAPVYEGYLSAQAALADDDMTAATRAMRLVSERAGQVDEGSFPVDSLPRWQSLSQELIAAADSGGSAPDLAQARVGFELLSRAMIALNEQFGHAGEASYYVVFCPMAFDEDGARWLQSSEVIENPYLGLSMLSCGEVEKALPGRAGR